MKIETPLQATPETLLGPEYAGKCFYRGKICSPTPPPPRSYWPDKRERYYFYKSVEGDSWTSILEKLKLSNVDRKRFLKLNAINTFELNPHDILPVDTTLFIDLDFSELMDWPPEFLMNILLPKNANEPLWHEVYKICIKQSQSYEQSLQNVGPETAKMLRLVWDVYDFLSMQYQKTQNNFTQIPLGMQQNSRKRYHVESLEPIQPPPFKMTKFAPPPSMFVPNRAGEEPLRPLVQTSKRRRPVFETERVTHPSLANSFPPVKRRNMTLKQMLDNGLIEQADYEKKKEQILAGSRRHLKLQTAENWGFYTGGMKVEKNVWQEPIPANRARLIETQKVQLSNGRSVIVDAQRISPFRTLFCHHCNTKFSARPSQRRPQSAFVLNHACSGQKRTQFVIGKRHRRCDFGCNLKVGCIKFLDE